MDIQGNFCLETRYRGEKVVFTEEQRALKSVKHPELRDIDFIKGRVKNAIEDPDFIYQDLAHPETRRIHYLKEYSINNETRYTKVVISKEEMLFFVITAYRPNYIKESGKTKMVYQKNV